MGLSEEFKKKIAETLAQGNVATRDELLENKDLALVVDPNCGAYANMRTTQAIDKLSDGEVTHLKSTPMVEDGVVVIEAAQKGEAGAEEFSRGETRRFGKFYFRTALNRFNLEWADNRNLVLPVTEDEIPMPDGEVRRVLIVTVKKPSTKERAVRSKKSGTQPTTKPGLPATNSAAGAQTGASGGTQSATSVPEGEKKA